MKDIPQFTEGEVFQTWTPVDDRGRFVSSNLPPDAVRPRIAGFKVRQYCVDLISGEVIELRLSDGRPGSDG